MFCLIVCIFDPACELVPPWTKELYGTCVLLPLYCTFSLWPTPPFPMYSIYRQCVTVGGGGWCWNVLWTIFGRIFTLCFWPDSEPTKLLHHPKTNMTSKDDVKGLVSLKFLCPCGAWSLVEDVLRRAGPGDALSGGEEQPQDREWRAGAVRPLGPHQQRIQMCRQRGLRYLVIRYIDKLFPVLWSRSRGAEIKLPPKAGEPKLRTATPALAQAPAPFSLSKKFHRKKHGCWTSFFNTILTLLGYPVNHASIHVKSTNTRVKKAIFKVSYKTIRSQSRAAAAIRIWGSVEPEPK